MKKIERKCNGFTFIEILVALTLSMLIMVILFELFLASQRTLKMQLALSTLETRMYRVTSIFRNDIHRAQGNVRVVGDNELRVGSNIYLVEKNKLVMIDANQRKIRLVEEVNNMIVRKFENGVDVSVHLTAGSLGETIHVFTALT